MSYYHLHLIFCTNIKENHKKCCGGAGGSDMYIYAKNKLKAMKLIKPGGVRVTSAGCMGRCAIGPVLVIYPEAVWYTYQTQNDIDEIIQTHVMQGGLVNRLLLPQETQ